MRLIVVVLVLILPTFAAVEAQSATGHVVVNWTSPNFGYDISYRRNALSLVDESTITGSDYLLFANSLGELIVETTSNPVSNAECALQAIDDVSDVVAHEPALDDQDNATATFTDGEREITVRASCLFAPDARYQIAFTRSAPTDQFGQFEIAARAVIASYRTGASESAGTPSPSGGNRSLVEVALIAFDPNVDPPPDSNLVNHPTRFFTVEIAFTATGASPATIEQDRIIIPGIGVALEHDWMAGGAASDSNSITVEIGNDVTGSFLFAVPQSQQHVVFCFQHVTSGDCTFLFEIRFPASGHPPIVEGASPREPLELDPGR